jgi:hypothetical protein
VTLPPSKSLCAMSLHEAWSGPPEDEVPVFRNLRGSAAGAARDAACGGLGFEGFGAIIKPISSIKLTPRFLDSAGDAPKLQGGSGTILSKFPAILMIGDGRSTLRAAPRAPSSHSPRDRRFDAELPRTATGVGPRTS